MVMAFFFLLVRKPFSPQYLDALSSFSCFLQSEITEIEIFTAHEF